MKKEHLIDVAYALAAGAHAGQLDKQGMPYILHPVAVAVDVEARYDHDELTAAALLHDVLEDTAVTSHLMCELVGEGVTSIVQEVTKQDGADYAEYIARLVTEGSTPALRLKFADLRHNTSVARGPLPSEKLMKKYNPAKAQIRNELIERNAL